MEGERAASEARFLRKHYKEGGYDEEQEQEDRQFKDDFEGALKNYSKGSSISTLEKQVEYFGYKIEPFNMRQEQQIGDIDQSGFFVFHSKKRTRDPWLDSLDQEGEEQLDQLKKKIKLEQREKTVYQASKTIEEEDKYQPSQEINEEGEHHSSEQEEDKPDSKEQEEKQGLKPAELKALLCQLLPFGLSANKYLKVLKKEKNEELYAKVVFLCNEYVSATGEHEILTLRKEDLEEQAESQKEEAPIANWDQSESEGEEDNIF